MERETIVWTAVALIVIFLVWKTIAPLFTPIVFGFAAAYILHPFHVRLSEKVGNRASSLIITSLMLVASIGFLIGAALWVTDVLRNIYVYLDKFFIWLKGLNVPPALNAVFDALSESFPERLSHILLGYTLSLPKLVLQIVVFLAVFYGALLNADFLSTEVYRLLPSTNRELGEKLIEKAKETLDAILKTWLFLSVTKGFLLALGFYIFGISNITGSIAAGILCVVLELLPVVGGWIMWAVGAFLLVHRSLLLAILFALYGAIFISPVPDIIVKPKLVARRARVSSVVALVGIFGGIIAFGAVGIVIGPIALGLLSALLDAWKEKETAKQPSRAHRSRAA
ncbi:AI-2E family transporter [Pyrococcus yayanosii]|uniref:Permease n=1 Tax=Pyrococcus yayanosii (strain CH1 / JCM 16557) TaxID=529709 RepID=F8AGZ1_PYRYC|nr:AI-2E family transporter [Pyrococcus yayanosii]AEH24049.1 hypothetical protein PYCH_03540 [Pyrococcus yayanosii CH1]